MKFHEKKVFFNSHSDRKWKEEKNSLKPNKQKDQTQKRDGFGFDFGLGL